MQRDASGTVGVAGYALTSGEDGPVMKVEILSDGGKPWIEPELIGHPDESQWSWKLWQAHAKLDAGSDKVVCSRATDKAGNTRPEQSQWNLRGVCYNGWGSADSLVVE